MPTVSAVVCAHTDKRWGYLVETIESLRKQTHRLHDIILIIDNNPALLERARAAFVDIVVAPNRQGQGLPHARNSGVAHARGEIVAFIDDDAAAAPDWIEQLIKPYAQPEVIGVGGGIVPNWDAGKPGWFPGEFNWVVGCSYIGMPTQDAPVRNTIGCNMSFRAKAFNAGGFMLGRVGSDTGQQHDDTEFCIRLSKNYPKTQIIYRPSAKVFHHVPAARSTLSFLWARCFSEGKSKAKLARIVGGDKGLSTERTYVTRTLPVGVLRGLRDGILKLQPSGFGRAYAIVAGFSATALGYARGMIVR